MDDLYHPRILELAADNALTAPLAAPHGAATRVSRVCGSLVHVEVRLEAGEIAALSVQPQACALGQAAAGVLAMHGVGASVDEVRAARDGLAAMLREGGPPPTGRFWELRHLEGVRHYPPRHTSTMLAFDACMDAIAEALAKSAA